MVDRVDTNTVFLYFIEKFWAAIHEFYSLVLSLSFSKTKSCTCRVKYIFLSFFIDIKANKIIKKNGLFEITAQLLSEEGHRN